MKNKVVVIGCGNVGVCYIYSLINQRLNIDEIVVIDVDDQKVFGEVTDFEHCLPFVNLDTKIYCGTYEDCADANIVVITAGVRQDKGETRMDLVNKNANLFKQIVSNVVKSGFNGIFINATNPLDVMTQLIKECSNFDSSKVIGTGTTLDTARFKYYLKNLYGVKYNSIKAYVLGEHGDSSVVPWSKITVDNKLVINTLFNKEQIERKQRNIAYEILNTKGYSSSAIGLCLTDITKSIIYDEKREFCVSNYDKKTDTYYGYPAIVGKAGIVRRVNLELEVDELYKLNHSINIIKEVVDKIK